MQELRLVAVSEDGTYLVMATVGRGTRFTLPIDDRLRAAVRGNFSRLGQYEIEVESPLRPKEIQARIRAGETAEEIAEAAGIPLERVRWFEGPVLQEREFIAQQALRVGVRRAGEGTPGPALGDLVGERLGHRAVDPEEAEWDSWKCDDGTWRVRLSFIKSGRHHTAHWVYDQRRRHVIAYDDDAARLVSDDPAAFDTLDGDDSTPMATVTPFVPRLATPPAEPPPPAPEAPVAATPPPAAPPVRPQPVPSAEPGPYQPAPRPRPAAPQEPPPAEPTPDQPAAAEPRPVHPAATPEPAPPQAEPAATAEPVPARPQAEPDPVHPQAEPEPTRPPAEPSATAEPSHTGPTPPAAHTPAPAPAPAPAPETPVAPPVPEPRHVQEPAAHAPTPPTEEPAPAARTPAAEPAAPAAVQAELGDDTGRQTEIEAEPAPKPKPARPAKRGRREMPPADPPAPVEQVEEPAASGDTVAPAPARRSRKGGRGRRASVPSWDEIMFGARKPD